MRRTGERLLKGTGLLLGKQKCSQVNHGEGGTTLGNMTKPTDLCALKGRIFVAGELIQKDVEKRKWRDEGGGLVGAAS